MIQFLRNPKIMRWGFLFFCLLIIPSFVLFYGFSDTPQTTMANTIVITLRTEAGTVRLTPPDVERGRTTAVNFYSSVAQQIFGPEFLPNRDRIQRDISNGLSQMEKAEFAIYNAAADIRLTQLRLVPTNNQVSALMQSEGVTRSQLRAAFPGASEYQIAQFFRSNVRGLLADSVVTKYSRVTLLELWQEFRLANDRIVLDMAEIPVIRDPDSAVSREELEMAYARLVEQDSSRVQLPERRVYRFVRLTAPLALSPEPTEEQLRAAWEAAGDDDRELQPNAGTQIRQIIVPSQGAEAAAREIVEGALARITGGEEFATVADDVARMLHLHAELGTPGLAEPPATGGLFPNRIIADREAEFGATWNEFVQTAEVGRISEIIETPQGMALVKIESRNELVKAPFDEVRSILATRLRRELRQQAIADRNAEIEANRERLEQALKEATTLDALAEILSVEVSTTNAVPSTATNIPGLGNIIEGQQDIAVLRRGVLSPIVETAANELAVVEIAEVLEPQTAPLEGDLIRIVEDVVRLERAASEAEELALAFFNRLRAEEDPVFNDLAAEMGLTPSGIPPFARTLPPARLQNLRNLETGAEEDSRALALRLREGQTRVVMARNLAGEPTRAFVMHVREIQEPDTLDFVEEIRTRPLEMQLRDVKTISSIEDFRRDVVRRYQPVFNANFIDPEPRARRR